MKILNLTEYKEKLENKDNYVIINANHFIKYYSGQPYWIFNKNSEIPNVDINGFQISEKINKVDNLDLLSLDQEDEEDDDSSKVISSWLKTFDDIENSYIWNYSKENETIYNKVSEQTRDFAKTHLTSNNYEEIIYIKPNDKLYTQFLNTIEAFNNPKVKYIFNPCFLINVSNKENKHFFIKDQSFLFDKELKILYQNRYVSSTNIFDYLKTFFSYNVYKKVGIDLEDIKLIIFEKFFNLEKGKLNFVVTNSAFAAAKYDKNDRSLELEAAIASGRIFNSEFDDFTKISYKGERNFLTSIAHNFVFKNPTIKEDIKENDLFNEKKEYLNFNNSINDIVNSYFIKAPTYSINNEFNLEAESKIGNTDIKVWKQNPLRKNIIHLFAPEIKEYSGNLKKLSTGVVKKDYIDEALGKIKELRQTSNYFNLYAVDLLTKLHKKNKRIIWYDYEGVTTPWPILNNVSPYGQVTHQVSFIETINGKEINVVNIVKDPKKIELIDLVDNVIQLYSNKADIYIVYNKGYENSRNNELLKYVEIEYNNNNLDFIEKMYKIGLKNKDDFKKIINHIHENTIDLWEFIKPCSKDKILGLTSQICFESTFLNENRKNEIIDFMYNKNRKNSISDYNPFKYTCYIYDLHLYSSIKKVEKLATAYKLNLRYKIKEYSKLDVKNGSMALEFAVSRAVGIMDDNVWNSKIEKLKEYCENDVRAMLLTYDFILEFMSSAFSIFKEYEYKLEENEKYTFDEKDMSIKIL
ncbi:Domain of uncharacterised function(DUF2779) [Mycoplasmopsis maculosa]|uniref:Domain of uncharacterized function(DUF2779) n=1 Tax=Mycoplasmopsis maculosa TaxID=114885 RepID=A0A449B4H8_9BACT|nr:DUF2779 domain-containing protein [Mycoplasmopsis maculosa]VEU75511.1 Domain of uncharacterised function(DUF2779) [Mycoplasmopsis maculosa]